MDYTIKTPFLGYVVRIIRLFGVFLLPRWSPLSLTSLLHLAWNLTVSTIAMRDLLSPSYYNREHLSREDIKGKPFLLQLYKYNFEWNYVFSYNSTLLYYMYTIPKMVPILDSLPVTRFYRRQGRQQIALLLSIFTLVDLLTFFNFHVGYLKEVHRTGWIGLFKLLLNEVALVGEFIYTYLPFSIACYTQLGTLGEMRRIQAELGCTISKDPQKLLTAAIIKIKVSIKELARANSTMHQLNSAPLAIYLVTTGIAIVIFCCSLSTDPDYGFFLYGVLVFSYQLTIATLSRRTKAILRAIVATLEKREMEQILFCQEKELLEDEAERKLAFRKLCETSRTLVQGDDLLDYYEAEVGVQVFALFSMDYAFLFTFVLFLLNHSVFLLQTKAKN